MTKTEKVKLSLITTPQVVTALSELSKIKLKAKISIHVSKALVQVQNQINDYEKVRVETLKKYANLNEANELIENEQGMVTFKDAEAAKAYNKEVSELLDQEVDVVKLSDKLLDDESAEIESWVLVAINPLFYS
jgi:hypothetical protein